MYVDHTIYTSTGRLKSKVLVFFDENRSLPPGLYEAVVKEMDFTPTEARCYKEQWVEPRPPAHEKPKKYKDVPFWCKRR